MSYKSLETGLCPESAYPKASPMEQQKPLRDQLSRWFFAPLEKLRGDQAFVAMILSIILVEKWLRVTRDHGEQEFSENSKPIRDFADHFGINPDIAYRFWQDWRNGLLHRAMPKVEHFDGYSMSDKFPLALQPEGNRLLLNPWRFRNRVLELVQPQRDLWQDSQCPLAKEFTAPDSE